MIRAIKWRSPFLSIRLPKTHIFCNLVAKKKACRTTKLLLIEMYVHTHYILFHNSLTFVHDSLIL